MNAKTAATLLTVGVMIVAVEAGALASLPFHIARILRRLA